VSKFYTVSFFYRCPAHHKFLGMSRRM